MGEVLLIRHGETQWNREVIWRGRADVPLGDRGREQARLLAEAWAARPIGAIYSSPLARARETAEPLAAAAGLAVQIDERLVDMSFGEWEGQPLADVQARWPDLYQTWRSRPGEFRAPGGESLAEVAGRAWPALEEMAARHAEQTVALVSHRVVCKLLLCAALGAGEAGFWRVWLDTASVSLLEREAEGWVVRGVNDTHHLSALGAGDAADF